MRRERRTVEERLARCVECLEFAVGVAAARAHLRHHAAAADRRDVVAGGAAGAVERRAQTFLRRLHLEEIVQPETELFELAGVRPGSGLPGGPRWRLRASTAAARTPADIATHDGLRSGRLIPRSGCRA